MMQQNSAVRRAGTFNGFMRGTVGKRCRDFNAFGLTSVEICDDALASLRQRRRMKLLGLIFSLLLVCASAGFGADSLAKNVDVDQFDKLRENKSNVILDVRTEKEFNAGHIPGATLVDFNSPAFVEKIAKLDKSKTYLVHCAAGVRSAKACQKLEAAGFTNIIHMPVGFQGWKKAGKPIEK